MQVCSIDSSDDVRGSHQLHGVGASRGWVEEHHSATRITPTLDIPVKQDRERSVENERGEGLVLQEGGGQGWGPYWDGALDVACRF